MSKRNGDNPHLTFYLELNQFETFSLPSLFISPSLSLSPSLSKTPHSIPNSNYLTLPLLFNQKPPPFSFRTHVHKCHSPNCITIMISRSHHFVAFCFQQKTLNHKVDYCFERRKKEIRKKKEKKVMQTNTPFQRTLYADFPFFIFFFSFLFLFFSHSTKQHLICGIVCGYDGVTRVPNANIKEVK